MGLSKDSNITIQCSMLKMLLIFLYLVQVYDRALFSVHVRLQVPEKLLAVTWLKEVEERDKETGRIHQKKTALTKELFISDLRYIGRTIACPVY